MKERERVFGKVQLKVSIQRFVNSCLANSLSVKILLVFSVKPFKIDQNKNQNHYTDKVQNLGNERR